MPGTPGRCSTRGCSRAQRKPAPHTACFQDACSRWWIRPSPARDRCGTDPTFVVTGSLSGPAHPSAGVRTQLASGRLLGGPGYEVDIAVERGGETLSLIHISEPTRLLS